MISLTPLQKKLVLAGLVSLFTMLGEIGYQLISGSINLTKAVVLGLAMGAIARVGGAVLSAVPTEKVITDG